MTTPNTSATGGLLLPNPAPAPQPIEDAALVDFFEELVVGITGLPQDLVRPRWQAQMPAMPDINTDWIALGIQERPSDTFPAISHQGSLNGGNGVDVLGRNETLEILVSIYGPNADGNAALLRDGLYVSQNREALQLAGMGLKEVDRIIAVPPLYNAQWYYRLDMKVYVQRLVLRTYPVLNLESIQGTIKTGDAAGVVTSVSFAATLD